MDCSLQHRIRERAYEIWSAEGRTHGRAEQHWLAAERQVLSEMAPQVSAPAQPVGQKKTVSARQRRSITNIRPQPKKVANAG